MTQIPVVLGLTALVAVPTAVGVHFLSASKTTQTQEVPEQNKQQQREVGQQEGNVRPPAEETTYDFSEFDVEATDLVEEETEVSRAPSQGSQPVDNQDSDYPKMTPWQLKFPAVSADLMGAADVQEGSIGARFKGYLLSDPKDNEWINKTKLWAKKFKEENTRGLLTSIFITSPAQNNKPSWSKISMSGLQARCKQAYSRTTWDMSEAKVDKDNYWNTVRELCGRNGEEFPSNWNQA